MTIEQHLDKLNPEFAAYLRSKWNAAQMAADLDDLDIKIVCSRRTAKQQAALYAKGRTAPGPKVTWTLNSRHLDGNAVDLGLFRKGVYMDEGNNALTYRVYLKIWKVWKHPRMKWLGNVGDPCHFEWH